MKKLLGLLVLLACGSGCIVAESDGPRHRDRETHSHCYGCGHVQVRGVWYVRH
jgi:hypothetical protein